MSIPMHSSEKNRIVRTISEMVVDAPAPCTELRQIYKVPLYPNSSSQKCTPYPRLGALCSPQVCVCMVRCV
jgi:hypothetical protein